MNLMAELDKVTAPPFCRSAVRSLSREEIDRLAASGEIVPVAAVPEVHYRHRLIYPDRWHNGRYFRYARR